MQIIEFGCRFERISEGNYDVRNADGENFVDDFDEEYSIHVYDNGDESWSATLVYDDDNIPESLPDHVQIAQKIEQEFLRAEEAPGMTAIKLMQQVAECQEDDWQNSDIGAPAQAELEVISDHFRGCQDCRAAFDAQDYPEETIQEFAARLSGAVEDWICDSEEKHDWKKMTSITLDIETILGMIIQNEDDLYLGNAGKIVIMGSNVSYVYPFPETEFPGSVVIDPSDLVDLNKMYKDGHRLDIDGYRDDARDLAKTGDLDEAKAEEISISDWKAWAKDYLKNRIETEEGTLEIDYVQSPQRTSREEG